MKSKATLLCASVGIDPMEKLDEIGMYRWGFPMRKSTPFATCGEFAIIPDFLNITRTSLLVINYRGLEHLRRLFAIEDNLMKEDRAQGDTHFGQMYQATGTHDLLKIQSFTHVRKKAHPLVNGVMPHTPSRPYYMKDLCEFDITKEALRVETACLVMPDGEPVVSVDIKKDVVFRSKRGQRTPGLSGTYRQVLVTTTKNIYLCYVNLLTLSCVRTH